MSNTEMDELEQLREHHQRHMNRNLELQAQLDEAREHVGILKGALVFIHGETVTCGEDWGNPKVAERCKQALAATPSEAAAKSAGRIAELEAQLAAESKRRRIAESEWPICQAKLGEIERNLNNFLGTQQGYVDSIEQIFAELRESRKAEGRANG